MLRKMRFLILWLIAILFANVAAAQSEYQVRVGDTLIVEVLEDNTLNRSLIVLNDGRISFPFAGTLRVAGQTVGQIESAIASAISQNFNTPPNVFVSVQPKEPEVRAPAAPAPDPTIDVYFVGEVNAPGLKAVAPGTTFLQAVAQSGGMTRFAAEKRVQLRRTDLRSGAESVFEINYQAILDGAEVRGNVVLQDGDVIVVPERRLFE